MNDSHTKPPGLSGQESTAADDEMVRRMELRRQTQSERRNERRRVRTSAGASASSAINLAIIDRRLSAVSHLSDADACFARCRYHSGGTTTNWLKIKNPGYT